MNTAYFSRLNETLKNYKRAIPFLLIDLDRLDENLTTLRASIRQGIDFRLVVKSLPSPPLIEYALKAMQAQKMMVFHQPFLTDLVLRSGDAVDILLGKPMPIKTAAYFYETIKNSSSQCNPYTQIQWLVDTEKRIVEYVNLAKEMGQKLRLNVEIDVGLHRGGFSDLEELSSALKLFQNHATHIEFSGLMGYDPHVVKMPRMIRTPEKALQLANRFYDDCKGLVKNKFPDLWNDNLTFNGAGSPTIALHKNDTTPLNDLSAGSCLIKPTTFDIPTLKNYLPACFIATPILKKFDNTSIPSIEKFDKILNIINKKNQQSYFIYGGYWKADYCYPESVTSNQLFGHSTNQNMINSPRTTQLEVDDFVFLRPQQSEFVLLQFGNILAYRDGKIIDEWNLLNQNN